MMYASVPRGTVSSRSPTTSVQRPDNPAAASLEVAFWMASSRSTRMPCVSGLRLESPPGGAAGRCPDRQHYGTWRSRKLRERPPCRRRSARRRPRGEDGLGVGIP